MPAVAEENYWFRRHEVAYRFAAERCRGRVVDAGCGEGYGAAILAGCEAEVVGVDLVHDVCVHADTNYRQAGFVRAEVGALPLPAGAVDAVVCLQVVEHLWDVHAFLAETRRVLRPGGLLLCSTPNRRTFTPGSDRPVNPFHVVEFSPAELAALLGTAFAVEELVGVAHGPRLATLEAARGRLADLLNAAPASRWPAWLRTTVASVTVDDFTVGADALDASLDLLAVCRRPGC